MEFLNPGLLGSEAAFRNARSASRSSAGTTKPPPSGSGGSPGRSCSAASRPTARSCPTCPTSSSSKVFCTLTREQATLYQSIVDDLVPDLERTGDEGECRGKVLRAILRLKQVCNHPAQLLARRLAAGRALRQARAPRRRCSRRSSTPASARSCSPSSRRWGEHAASPTCSETFGREVLFLHGGAPRRQRDQLVARFQTSGAAPIFVLSLKAGGTGLNLVAANHVFHYDRWWNPAVEDQATDRAYRIGQTRDVQVHKFVAAGTLEEHIAEMLKGKRDLAARVVRAGERAFTDLSPAELREVLALGATALGEAGSEADA